jgi:hypothetical protein
MLQSVVEREMTPRKETNFIIGLMAAALIQSAVAIFLLTGAARAPNVPRDSHGRIERSVAAKDAFKLAHPCPATGASGGPCPGYVIDHIIPLKRGGPDAPQNMQWQDTISAKAKDKVE